VTLSITDPPPQGYDSSITAIEVTFTRIEIHATGAGNETGWHTLMPRGTMNLLNVLNISQVLGTTTVPAGKYSEIRFFLYQTIITINAVNIPYTVPSASQTGFKVVITGGGFQVIGGLSVTVMLDSIQEQ